MAVALLPQLLELKMASHIAVCPLGGNRPQLRITAIDKCCSKKPKDKNKLSMYLLYIYGTDSLNTGSLTCD